MKARDVEEDTHSRDLQRALVESACTEDERRSLLQDVKDLLTSGRTSVAFFPEPECTSSPVFKPEDLVLGARYYTRPSREMVGLRAVRTGESSLSLIEAGGEAVQVYFGEPQHSGPLSPVPKTSRNRDEFVEPASRHATVSAWPSSSFAIKLGRRRGGSAPRGAVTTTGGALASGVELHRELEAANLELMRRRRELRDHQVRLSEAELMLEDRRALHDKHREMAAEAVRMEETHAEELQALRNQLVQESEARAIAVKGREELQAKARAHISALQARHEESVEQQLNAAQSKYETELQVHQDQANTRIATLHAERFAAMAGVCGNKAHEHIADSGALGSASGGLSGEDSVAANEFAAIRAELAESNSRAAAAEHALHESYSLRADAEQQASNAKVRLAVLQSEKDGVVTEWSRAEVRSAKLEAAHADARIKLKKARQELDQLRSEASSVQNTSATATATRVLRMALATPNSEQSATATDSLSMNAADKNRNTHFELWQAQQKEEQLRTIARKHENEARIRQAKSICEEETRDTYARDIEVLRSRETELMGELASTNGVLASASAECTELRAALKEHESVMAESEAAAVHAADATNELQARCDNLQRALDSTEQELAASLAEANARSEAVASLEAERETWSVREQEMVAKHDDALAEWSSREAELLSDIVSHAASLRGSREECVKLRSEQQSSADENATLVAENSCLQQVNGDFQARCVNLQRDIRTAEEVVAATNDTLSAQVDHLRLSLSHLQNDKFAMIQLAADAEAKYVDDREFWFSQHAVLTEELDAKTAALADMETRNQTTAHALAAAKSEIQKLSLRESDAAASHSRHAALWKDRETELRDSIANMALECAELRSEMHGVHQAEEVLLSQRQTLTRNLDQTKVANVKLESQCAELQKSLKLAEQQAADASGAAEASAAELRNVQKTLELLGDGENVNGHTQQMDSDAVTDRVLNRATDAEARCAKLEAVLAQAEHSAQQKCAALKEKLVAESCRAEEASRRLDVSVADCLVWRSRFEDETAARAALHQSVHEHQDAERVLMQHTQDANAEANAKLAELEAALRENAGAYILNTADRPVTPPQDEAIEKAVALKAEMIERTFQAQLQTVEDVAAQQLSAAEHKMSILQEQIADLTHRLADAQRDDQDWLQLERDFAAQMKQADKESRKRQKAEARLDEAWEELSNLHESVEAASRSSFCSTQHSVPSNPTLQECLRDQIANLKSKGDLIGPVRAQILVDDHRCDIRIERSETDESHRGRSALEMWAETTGTELRPAFGHSKDRSDDISPIPRGDVSSLGEHTRAQLVGAREQLAELARAKHAIENELRKEQKLRRKAEAAVNGWQNTSVPAVDHQKAVDVAVEAAVAETEEKAQAWILRIATARKAERKAIEDERREALSERDALRAELSWHQSQTMVGLSADEVTMTGRSPSAAVFGALSQFCE